MTSCLVTLGLYWFTIAFAVPVGDEGGLVNPTSGSLAREEYVRFSLSHPGDPKRGRALFTDASRLACTRCHRVLTTGGDIGPDLSDVGGKFGREQLVESVLEPSRQITEGYRPSIVSTTHGQVLTGIVKQESVTELKLIDATGKQHSIRKTEIDWRKVGDVSLMPDGLATGISREEFVDLIAYLQGLRASGQGTPGSATVGPVTLPPEFSRASVASGITGATAMAVAPDGRVFVCEQTGALRVVKADSLLTAPFVELEVDSTWERGLIGVTLDPAFARNGYVYVCYVTPAPSPRHRISRLTARNDIAVAHSEVILFEGDDQSRLGGSVPAGHQGGALHFGLDGKLYIGIGDQTASRPSQDLGSLLGKILRLDPDGSIPDDNPFAATAQGKYRAIWARGLRNPFTFAVQPGTGRMLINDVGQDRWEEINEGAAGANYGWPQTEGPTTVPGIRGPIYHYPVASIVGGAFCPSGPSTTFPAQYRGHYFFADFVKGWIKILDPDNPAHPETFATGLSRPVGLEFAPDGSLLVLMRDAWVKDKNFRPGTGSLHRIRYRTASAAD
jgi:putative heme-binding domain-containing protein